jgi:hypothetical protein
LSCTLAVIGVFVETGRFQKPVFGVSRRTPQIPILAEVDFCLSPFPTGDIDLEPVSRTQKKEPNVLFLVCFLKYFFLFILLHNWRRGSYKLFREFICLLDIELRRRK